MEEVYGLTNFDPGVKNCLVYWSLTMTTHAFPFLYFTSALHIRPKLLFFVVHVSLRYLAGLFFGIINLKSLRLKRKYGHI
jgi:hypothetical protein